jgi:hypothetical protein
MKNLHTFESFINEANSNQLSRSEYTKYFPVLGGRGVGLEFNFNEKTIGGYVVPKEGDDLEDLIAQIERATSRKLTAIPYDQERQIPVSGTKAGWTRGGNEIWLQVINK